MPIFRELLSRDSGFEFHIFAGAKDRDDSIKVYEDSIEKPSGGGAIRTSLKKLVDW